MTQLISSKQVILSLVFIFSSLTGCTQYIQISENTDKFRIGNASGAYLGSLGYVTGEGVFGGHNKYTRDYLPEYHDINISNEGEVDYSNITFSDADLQSKFEADFAKKFGVEIQAGGGAGKQKELKAKFHILSFDSPAKAISKLNAPENIESFDQVKKRKDGARIVSKVLMAFNYNESKKLEATGNLKVSGSGSLDQLPVDTKVSGEGQLVLKTSKSETINLSDGMIVGYSYDILCWDKDNQNKLEITTSVYQKYGTSVDCRVGKNNPDEVQ